MYDRVAIARIGLVDDVLHHGKHCGKDLRLLRLYPVAVSAREIQLQLQMRCACCRPTKAMVLAQVEGVGRRQIKQPHAHHFLFQGSHLACPILRFL